MGSADYLRDFSPSLADRLARTELASLPTPVREHSLRIAGQDVPLAVKYDDQSGDLYGGNKVRKLEYIFSRARTKERQRIATFGAAGSHHALATALYARRYGFECTCFLGSQPRTPAIAATLNRHVQNGTRLVSYGGNYAKRISILRRNLWGQCAWIVPMGGSSWLGTVGFVAAGLELANQVQNEDLQLPERIYVATGTMGTAAGIALGLALAELPTEVHAVRVSDTSYTNPQKLHDLMDKTAGMLNRLDKAFPADLTQRTNIKIRNEFFGNGYAIPTSATLDAIVFAREQLDLELEPTYTGKAMAALLADLDEPQMQGKRLLYWHTYHSEDLGVPLDRPLDSAAIPAELMRYFSQQTPAS